jgi:hypothetical protein
VSDATLEALIDVPDVAACAAHAIKLARADGAEHTAAVVIVRAAGGPPIGAVINRLDLAEISFPETRSSILAALTPGQVMLVVVHDGPHSLVWSACPVGPAGTERDTSAA